MKSNQEKEIEKRPILDQVFVTISSTPKMLTGCDQHLVQYSMNATCWESFDGSVN